MRRLTGEVAASSSVRALRLLASLVASAAFVARASFRRTRAKSPGAGWYLYVLSLFDCLPTVLAVCQWASGIAGGSGFLVSGCFPLSNSLRLTDLPTAVCTTSPFTQFALGVPVQGLRSAITLALEPCAPHFRHQMVSPDSTRWCPRPTWPKAVCIASAASAHACTAEPLHRWVAMAFHLLDDCRQVLHLHPRVG